jgi:uncharacterized protein
VTATGERDLGRLLAGMGPDLDPARYAFCRVQAGMTPGQLSARGVFHEQEGVTLILGYDEAVRAGLVPELIARRIELTIHSDLNAVGFMARIAQELAAADVPCNPVSAIWHDHLFVPEALADRAMAVLRALEANAARAERPVIYAVTVRIDPPLAAEWLEWMRTVHVPDVLATGCFRRCSIQQEAESGGERITFVLEYLAASAQALERYQRDHAPALQQLHSARYAGRFDASRVIRTLAAEVTAALA